MTCPSCEQPVEDAALFCGNCGFHIREETAATSAAEAVAPAAAVSAPAPVPNVPTPAAASAAPTPPAVPQPVATLPAVAAQTGQPAQPIPGYAVPQPGAVESHTLELVLSILSIPAALFPLLGFGLSIPALVIARKHKATAPTAIAIVGIVLSVLVVIFNIVYYVQHPEEQSSNSSSTMVISPLRSLTN